MNYKEDIVRYRLERAEETYQEALLMQREKHGVVTGLTHYPLSILVMLQQ